MTSSDRHATRIAALGVLVVALTAAVISFSHVRTVALRAGETELTSWLLPVSIDGAVVAAVSVLLADSRAGRRPARLTWLLLALGLSASLAANVASAEPTAVARAVAAWPPIALALGIEVLAGLARRADRSPSDEFPHSTRWSWAVGHRLTTSGTGRPAAGRAAGGRGGMLPTTPASTVNTQVQHRSAEMTDDEAVERIRALDYAASSGRASRLEIQRHLGCGGSRAARLADLARRERADLAS